MTQTGYGAAGPQGYQTASSSTRSAADEEQQPLLNGANGNGNGHSSKSSLTSRVRQAAKADVKRDWADVVLILCYVITGLLDSSSISIWGSFVSMQTGKAV